MTGIGTPTCLNELLTHNLKPMKTHHYLSVLALTAIIGACSKERSPFKSEKPLSASEQVSLKYSEEVIVFDQARKHSVTYRIESDNAESVKAMKKDLEAVRIQLLNEVPQISDKTKDKPTSDKAPQQPVTDQKGIYLKEINRNIGNALGYSVEAVRQKDGYLESYSTITVTADNCYGLYISNQWLYQNYNYFYWSNDGGASWVFSRMETLTFNQNYYFTSGGYGTHRIVSQPSYINSSFSVNNRIYWAVL